MAPNKIADLSALTDELAAVGASMHILVDNPDQVKVIEAWESTKANHRKWSVFMKVDCGNQYVLPHIPATLIFMRHRRAGLRPDTAEFNALLQAVLASSSISLYGFYTHAGNSYASTSFEEASNFLLSEVNAVNNAAGLALQMMASKNIPPPREPFVLSVGATPTAHAATPEMKAKIESALHGVLELHAGSSRNFRRSVCPILTQAIRKLPSSGPPAAQHWSHHPP